jgi:hypothetical protein
MPSIVAVGVSEFSGQWQSHNDSFVARGECIFAGLADRAKLRRLGKEKISLRMLVSTMGDIRGWRGAWCARSSMS